MKVKRHRITTVAAVNRSLLSYDCSCCKHVGIYENRMNNRWMEVQRQVLQTQQGMKCRQSAGLIDDNTDEIRTGFQQNC